MKYSKTNGGYQLQEDGYQHFFAEGLPNVTHPPFIDTKNGMIRIQRGFFWDGPSGPAVDTDTFLQPSMIHDAGYTLMGNGLLDPEVWRPHFDARMRRDLRKNTVRKYSGSWIMRKLGVFRAKYAYRGVRIFGGSHLEPREILDAP